jgi:hypothetical protein
MSETTIGPCPVCGWTHNDVHDGFRTCRNCGFDAACVNFGGVLGWDDLSRAAALLRAVEALETVLRERNDDVRGSVLLDEHLIAEMGWGEVVYGPLTDALRALAGEVKR